MSDRVFDIEELLAESRPRAHHYEFAHSALKLIAFGDPAVTRQWLDRGDALGRLWRLWETVGRRLPEDQRLNATGLALNRFGLGLHCCLYTVALPTPERTTEAHFVGIAITSGGSDGPQMRYFTLEKGLSGPGDPPRTALCEWSCGESGIAHLNYGDGPPPTSEDFARRVAPMLGESPQSLECRTSANSLHPSILSEN